MNEPMLDQCRAILGKCEEDACQNGAVQLRADKASASDFDRVLDALQALGLSLLAGREEAGNRFADLAIADRQLHAQLAYFPSDALLRLILTEGEALPPQPEAPVCLTAPLVTQVKLAYCAADCGMSYVIRLCDGRFVVIDGGYHEYEEPLRLLETLQEQNVLPGRPTVAAWFISHPHGDHFECLLKLLRLYGDQILIQQMLYNWATDKSCRYPCDHEAFDAAVRTLAAGGCEILTPHTGQRLVYADAVFDVLFACEDLYPAQIRNTNDTSLVLRMELCGKRVLWLADAEPASCDVICRRFPAESIKCDILQVGHHGYDGGSPELYRRSDPETLLWPCPDFWYYPVREWRANDFLRESPNIKRTFVGGRYSTVIDMTAALPEPPAAPCYEKGDVIAAWDFARLDRVIDLDWSCVSGGDTGYWTPALGFTPEGECTVDAGEHPGLVELLRPDRLCNAPSYRMELQGRIGERFEELGLLCNDPTPTQPDREKLLMIPAAPGQELQLRLALDADAALCRLTVNGTELYALPYTPAARHGLYLYLKNTSLRLSAISVIR